MHTDHCCRRSPVRHCTGCFRRCAWIWSTHCSLSQHTPARGRIRTAGAACMTLHSLASRDVVVTNRSRTDSARPPQKNAPFLRRTPPTLPRRTGHVRERERERERERGRERDRETEREGERERERDRETEREGERERERDPGHVSPSATHYARGWGRVVPQRALTHLSPMSSSCALSACPAAPRARSGASDAAAPMSDFAAAGSYSIANWFGV
jgi:hypothetical protein